MADPKNPGGLGDIHNKGTDPIETYFDMVRQGVRLPRRRWIVKPDWNPDRDCKVPGLESLQKFFECHQLPRLWQLATDFWTKLQCGTYFTKRPNWIEPPITARCLEIRNNDPVPVPNASYVPGGGSVVVARTCLPDRFVGTLLNFGNEVANPAQLGDIVWNINLNGFPVPCYQDFKGQLGSTIEPTPLPNPIKLKHLDCVEVTAKNLGPDPAAVFARLNGFMFPARFITQDGSFDEYHVL